MNPIISNRLTTCARVPRPQFMLNGGRPVGQSIPATEHSVMTAWPTEQVGRGAMRGGGERVRSGPAMHAVPFALPLMASTGLYNTY